MDPERAEERGVQRRHKKAPKRGRVPAFGVVSGGVISGLNRARRVQSAPRTQERTGYGDLSVKEREGERGKDFHPAPPTSPHYSPLSPTNRNYSQDNRHLLPRYCT